MSKIEIISSTTVKMANNGGASTSISTMELTPWDFPFMLMDPIQKGILFDHKPDHESLVIIDHLKNSLSLTLTFFPPLAGRLSRVFRPEDETSSFFVVCNNAGVQFTHAVGRRVSVSDVVEPTYIPSEIVSSLFPLNGIRNVDGVTEPLVGFQVTELTDGYFIACTANHVVVDGTSFWHFFNSWSEISRGLGTISKIPVFQRWFPTTVSPNDRPLHIPTSAIQNPSHKIVNPPLLERLFHFSKESVAKLKAMANYEAESNKISSLQALSAHVWRSVIRARLQSNDPQNQEITFVLLVGTRARIPLPDGYFGNAVYIAKTALNELELLQHGLGWTATKINKLVSQQTREEVVRDVEDWVKNPVIPIKGRLSFIISSSPRHNVYGNDFGWGKPIAVRSGAGQKFDGKMTVFPASESGGIDVEVCLATQTLRDMEDDAEFMEAVTI